MINKRGLFVLFVIQIVMFVLINMRMDEIKASIPTKFSQVTCDHGIAVMTPEGHATSVPICQ